MHTPGPWEWRCYDNAGRIQLEAPERWASDMSPIVTPEQCNACVERGAPCLGPSPDDARLIAAAPDLLDACKTAIRICGYASPTAFREHTDDWDKWCDGITEIHAAVDKAERATVTGQPARDDSCEAPRERVNAREGWDK